jgi:hypothetical protein
MGLKNLSPGQFLRLSTNLFDCQVLGHPPCCKSGSPISIISRAVFYILGSLAAVKTLVYSLWDDGQRYTQLDTQGSKMVGGL